MTTTNKIPSASEVRNDLIEYWCHTIFLSGGTGDHIQDCAAEMAQLIEAASDQVEIPKYGRLYNRTALAGFAQDVCSRPTTEKKHAGAMVSLHPSDWKKFTKTLGICRDNMLRADCDAGIDDEENDAQDEERALQSVFDDFYLELRNLFECHQAVAKFREDLVKEVKTPPKMHDTRLRHIRNAIKEYEKNIPETMDNSKGLKGFLRKDLLQANSNLNGLPQKLLKHLNTVMNEQDQPHSYNTLQKKTRALLRKWCETNLTMPTLVRLGYGGMYSGMNVVGAAADTTTVSSWGAAEDGEDKEERGHLDSTMPLAIDQAANPQTLREAAKELSRKPQSEDESDYHTADEDEEQQFATQAEEPRMATVQEESSEEEEEEEAPTERRQPARKGTRRKPKQAAAASSRRVTRSADTRKPAPQQDDADFPVQDDGDEDDEKENEEREEEEEVVTPKMTGTKRKAPSGGAETASSQKKTRPSLTKKKAAWGYSSDSEDEVLVWGAPKSRHLEIAPKKEEKQQKKRQSLTSPSRTKKDESSDSWSAAEEEAIKKGVEKYGTANWRKIRKKYQDALGNRVWTQIKDHYREMKHSGELEEE